jgi:Tfp pilus assembly protein PilF
MSAANSDHAACALGLLLLLTASGCASWKQQLAAQPSVADERARRQAEAIHSFEQHRDHMQLQAAIDRFNQGDIAGCESRLHTLVQRRPDFTEARLRLAELYWSRGDAAAAEEHYRDVLTFQPDNAEAHSGLGILLDDSGRSAEAAQHLAAVPE